MFPVFRTFRNLLIGAALVTAGPTTVKALTYGPQTTVGPAGAAVRTCSGLSQCCRCSTSSCQGTCNDPGSWSQAIENAQPGDTILLEGGTYQTSGNLDVASGTPGNLVTVASYDGATDVIVRSPLRFDRPGYAHVEGIAFKDPGSPTGFLDTSYVLSMESDSTSNGFEEITLKNCQMIGGTNQVILLWGNVNRVTIDGCDLDGGKNHHVIRARCNDTSGEPATCDPLKTPRNLTITNNDFSKLTFDFNGCSECGDLLQIEGGGDNIVVANNDFHDNQGHPDTEDCVDIKGEGVVGARFFFRANRVDARSCNQQGLLVHGNRTSPDDMIIEGNYFIGTPSDGVGIESSAKATLRNNVFDDARLRAINDETTNIIYNTFVGGKIQVGGASSRGQCPSSVILTNNIFSGTEMDLRDPGHCSGNRPHYTRVTNNILNNLSGDQVTCDGCMNVDPQLRSDGSIVPTSPAVDAADATIVVSSDMAGNGRPAGGGYDIGAYEAGSGSPPSLAPPVLVDVVPLASN